MKTARGMGGLNQKEIGGKERRPFREAPTIWHPRPRAEAKYAEPRAGSQGDEEPPDA